MLEIYPHELRIGNWIESYTVMDNGAGVISSPTIRFVQVDVAILKFIVENKFATYRPVLITPEILEKATFEYLKIDGIASLDNDDDSKEGDTHNWTIRVKQRPAVDAFSFELVKWGEQEFYTFSNHWLRRRLKYVHELQNLFYALTNYELEIPLWQHK